MRNLLLTGASLMFTMGIALAQTSTGANSSIGAAPGAIGTQGQGTTSSGAGVAPGGGTTQGGNAGAMSTAPAGGSSGTSSTGTSSTGTSTTGTTSENAPAMPNSNTAVPEQRRSSTSQTMDQSHMGATSAMSSGSAMGPMHHHHHHMMMHHHMANGMSHGTNNMEMGSAATPAAYLHMAEHALNHHQKARAEDYIGRAETDVLNAPATGQSGSPTDNPQVETLSKARSAVMSGDYSHARSLIHQAMANMSNGSMGHGMSNGSMSNGMSNGSMSHGMSNGSMSHGMSNGAMNSGAGMSTGAASPGASTNGGNGSMGNGAGAPAASAPSNP